ncbi:MAG: RagB/SusD family nutrient uptake outer membrane protein [Bacteroidaceae bacterium]|nr:RagB/SusD family nutrient uptake outer membrane protein [Bacteroidaceae bacterium]
MKKLNIIAFGILGLMVASCSDYLETSSPSIVDADFVFSNETRTRGALDGAYETWRDAAQNSVFGDGLFYAADVAGSDIERHPEGFTNQMPRHYPECFYQNGTYTSQYTLDSYLKNDQTHPYNRLFKVIGQANAIITAIEGSAKFGEITKEKSALSQMYGEAMALRAVSYRELIKYFGDVPYAGTNGKVSAGLVSRDSIYDICIADLQKVVGLMYPLGQMPGVEASDKHYFSKTFVQGLIGRLCLEAGGYQTRRNDIKPVNGKGEALTIETKGAENQKATYGRRSDWKNLYEIARTHLADLINEPGTVKFHETDPRGTTDKSGRTFNCPYQYFFEQMMMADAAYADESIYEYAMTQGSGNDGRPYSFGRPSSGGSKNAYPCKSYGQGRINPAYYYGKFNPKDMRRDVSICVTGSAGDGTEKLIPFKPGSKSDAGGLSLNKWDENRQVNPWTAAQRTSGINGPYMRISEMYLAYAEVCAALGDDNTATTYLKKVRERSFRSGQADTETFIRECGNSVWRAVIEDRGFEFAGEGDRRWTLIRTGLIGEVILDIKSLTTEMMNGLAANGYYTFKNGNQISLYVWTKMVDAKTDKGHRLTANGVGLEDDPVLYPGWRGQNDNWESYGAKAIAGNKTNLAIKGLFKHIAPDSEEAKSLEADGYTKQDWGKGLLNARDEYEKYLFYDYDGNKAPIYLWPFTHNILVTGGFTNGYGFKNE